MSLESLIHPIKVRVAAAVAVVKADADKKIALVVSTAKADKALIAADVKTAVTAGEAAISEATPELEAIAKAGYKAAKLAVEAALASHGL